MRKSIQLEHAHIKFHLINRLVCHDNKKTRSLPFRKRYTGENRGTPKPRGCLAQVSLKMNAGDGTLSGSAVRSLSAKRRSEGVRVGSARRYAHRGCVWRKRAERHEGAVSPRRRFSLRFPCHPSGGGGEGTDARISRSSAVDGPREEGSRASPTRGGLTHVIPSCGSARLVLAAATLDFLSPAKAEAASGWDARYVLEKPPREMRFATGENPT